MQCVIIKQNYMFKNTYILKSQQWLCLDRRARVFCSPFYFSTFFTFSLMSMYCIYNFSNDIFEDKLIFCLWDILSKCSLFSELLSASYHQRHCKSEYWGLLSCNFVSEASHSTIQDKIKNITVQIKGTKAIREKQRLI